MYEYHSEKTCVSHISFVIDILKNIMKLMSSKVSSSLLVVLIYSQDTKLQTGWGLKMENFLVKLKNKDHVSCLSSRVSRLPSEFFQVSERLEFPHVSMRSQLQPIWVKCAEFFQVPRHSSRENAIYVDSRLASLGASLYCLPDLIQFIWARARNYSKSSDIYIGRKLYTTTHTSLF